MVVARWRRDRRWDGRRGTAARETPSVSTWRRVVLTRPINVRAARPLPRQHWPVSFRLAVIISPIELPLLHRSRSPHSPLIHHARPLRHSQTGSCPLLTGTLSLTFPQLVFYGAYHNNATNVLIHMIFVPVIVWQVPRPLRAPRKDRRPNNHAGRSKCSSTRCPCQAGCPTFRTTSTIISPFRSTPPPSTPRSTGCTTFRSSPSLP